MTPFIGFLFAASAVMPVGQKIILTSLEYGLDPIMSIEVARCESGFNTKAVGDAGKAYGVYQFHKPTFDRFAKEAGVKLDYTQPDHQIELFMWAIKQGYASHWTCHSKQIHKFS